MKKSHFKKSVMGPF